MRNLNVAVREWEDQVVFLHRIVEGGTDRSYGIHVARLAGIPPEVLSRARQLLSELAVQHVGSATVPKSSRARHQDQLELFENPAKEIAKILAATNLAGLSPADALNLLRELQKKATS